MAFQMNITLSTGIVVEDAYLKIGSITGGKEQLDIYLMSYPNRQAAIDKLDPLEVKRLNFVPSMVKGEPNFIEQGYEYAKTEPDYKDAVDILEEEQTPLD